MSSRPKPSAASRGRGWRPLAVALLSVPLGFGACVNDKNSIVEASLGTEASAAAIDQDPWALLPAGPVGWAYVDAQRLFASRFGPTALNLVLRRLPALQATGFDAKRDLSSLSVGVYSIQGADFVGVAKGNFNRAQIEAHVEQNPVTPLGIPLTKTSYGERTLFMAESIGFCLLTDQTVLFGNQMGMRRAIDRVRRGRLERSLPDWLESQLKNPQAPIVSGLNLKENPLSAAARSDLPFLNGMGTLGVLANFEEPGMNLAGTAQYDDENAARLGAQNLEAFDDYLQSMGWVMALFGVAQPLRSLTAEAQGTQARFVAQVDGALVDRLLAQADGLLPGAGAAPPGAAPGTTPGSAPAPGAGP
ncbi:MAG TPA: hypothetical protein VFU02_04815 [Polyangiaceae bacterium]|nr:hypothetical protein [Polyangiaceae bacterium]